MDVRSEAQAERTARAKAGGGEEPAPWRRGRGGGSRCAREFAREGGGRRAPGRHEVGRSPEERSCGERVARSSGGCAPGSRVGLGW